MHGVVSKRASGEVNEPSKKSRHTEVKRKPDEDTEARMAEVKRGRYEIPFGEMDMPPIEGDDQEKYNQPGQFLELAVEGGKKGDYWVQEKNSWVRVHVVPRRSLFTPCGTRGALM